MLQTVLQMAGDATKERLRLVRWFRQNACMRQGIPFEEDKEPIGVSIDASDLRATLAEHRAAAKPADSPATPAASVDPSTPPASTSLLRRLLPYILAASTGVGGFALHQWLQADSDATVPATPKHDSSLLQWLEDQGEHIP